MFNRKEEEQHYEQRKAERSLKRQKMSESVLRKKYVATTALRRGRVERLQKLKQEAMEEETERHMAMMIPDGHVETKMPNTKLLKDASAQQQENVDTTSGEGPEIRLPKMRSCYVCKICFRGLHSFYDQLCPTCAPINWDKRHGTHSTGLHTAYSISMATLRFEAESTVTPGDRIGSVRQISPGVGCYVHPRRQCLLQRRG